jgi:hypothetical protein
MGILDDLREQANDKQLEREENILQQEKLEHNYQMNILPKMQQLYAYFKELLEYLAVIESPICIEHYSERYKLMGKLYQQDYRLTTDQHGGIAHIDKLKEVNLKFYCLGDVNQEAQFRHTVSNKTEMDQEKDFLSKHKIPFDYDRYLGNNTQGSFSLIITRKIPVLFRFKVDYEQSRISLTMINHENFEIRTQFINPEQINETYLDKLARYILRKDTEFLKIELDEAYKVRLRQQLEAQRIAKEKELQEAMEREAMEKRKLEENKISSKMKTMFQQIMDKKT